MLLNFLLCDICILLLYKKLLQFTDHIIHIKILIYINILLYQKNQLLFNK